MNTSLLKNRRALGAAAVSAGLLVPLSVFGAPALAGSAGSEYQYGPSQYQYKIQICHHTHSKKHPTHTINVSVRAWPAHVKHGDTLGPCPPAAPSTSSPSTHGKSNAQHGNGNGNGKGHGK